MPTATVTLPDKLFYRIGEVADLVGVKPHVLRYWESEFHILKPAKTRANHRLYRRRDVETLLRIKALLHDERLTIQGARKRLQGATRPTADTRDPAVPVDLYRETLRDLKREVESLCHLLR